MKFILSIVALATSMNVFAMGGPNPVGELIMNATQTTGGGGNSGGNGTILFSNAGDGERQARAEHAQRMREQAEQARVDREHQAQIECQRVQARAAERRAGFEAIGRRAAEGGVFGDGPYDEYACHSYIGARLTVLRDDRVTGDIAYSSARSGSLDWENHVRDEMRDIWQRTERAHGVSEQRFMDRYCPPIVSLPAAIRFSQFSAASHQEVIDALAQIPDPRMALFTFQSNDPQIIRQFVDLYKAPTPTPVRTEARHFGIAATEFADRTFTADPALSHQALHVGRELLDIAVGFYPPTSMGRDAYELVTGRHLISQQNIEDPGIRSSALFNLATLGFARSPRNALRFVRLVAQQARAVVNLPNWQSRLSSLERVVQTSETTIAPGAEAAEAVVESIPDVHTPWEPASQGTSQECMIARARVLEGQPLYRIGTRTYSQTGRDAQFWSLENPASSASYAARYGMPAESSSQPNFIEIGTMSPGAHFVTRHAPRIGTNGGGAVEVVVPPTGVVQIRSHTSL